MTRPRFDNPDSSAQPLLPKPPFVDHDERIRRRAAEILSRPDVMDKIEQQARYEETPRMASKTPLTDEARADLRSMLREVCAKAGWTVRLARMAGIAASVVSQVLADPPTYRGDADSALRKLEAAWLAWQAAQNAPRRGDFVETQVARDIFAVCHTANKIGSIGLVVGPSGLGKTLCLRAIVAQEYPSAIYVEINDGCASPLNFYRAVLRAISRGIPPGNSRAVAFAAICARLRDSNRMILVDEADQLSNETLNAIRQLHDETGCPVVLAGRPNLLGKIDRTRRDERIGGSVAGRICVRCNLMDRVQRKGGGAPLFSVDEIAAMLAKFKLRLRRDGARWLAQLVNLVSLGDEGEGVGLRYAIKVFQLAAVANRGAEAITVDMLIEAHEHLMGSIAADRLTALAVAQEAAEAKAG